MTSYKIERDPTQELKAGESYKALLILRDWVQGEMDDKEFMQDMKRWKKQTLKAREG